MYGFYDYEYESNKDVVGNQIRPKSQEIYGWQSTVLSNPDGLYKNPYRFYLQRGTHEIVLTFTREAGAIRNIQFIAPVVNPSYEEYKAQNGFSEDAVYQGDAIKKELEVPDYATSLNIRMESGNDYYTSSETNMDPFRVTLFNVFGGEQWGSGGDTVQWSFYVEESGWYELGFRYRSQATYVSSFKEIRIDGAVPFAEMEKLLDKICADYVFVDFHGETTSEKEAFSWYFDGRVSAVVGTHTHVQTNDARILPNGTAYLSDVGMTGPYDGILGMKRKNVIKRFLTQMPTRFEVDEDGRQTLGACVIDLDDRSNKAKQITPILINDDHPFFQ